MSFILFYIAPFDGQGFFICVLGKDTGAYVFAWQSGEISFIPSSLGVGIVQVLAPCNGDC